MPNVSVQMALGQGQKFGRPSSLNISLHFGEQTPSQKVMANKAIHKFMIICLNYLGYLNYNSHNQNLWFSGYTYKHAHTRKCIYLNYSNHIKEVICSYINLQ